MNAQRTLLIEGWRSIPHSYAIVNGFQCLRLLAEPNLNLRHRDVPYFPPDLRRTTGLFGKDEEAIQNIPGPVDGEIPDAVYRIAYPYNVSPSVGRRTLVFGTAEAHCVPNCNITCNRSVVEACRTCDALIVTPSNWSRNGFIHSGVDPNRVAVVPHGVDPAIYHPCDPAERARLRAQRGWNGFHFLTVGAMTPLKGIGTLLKAFAAVANKHPDVRMIMKGLGALYPSHKLVMTEGKSLTPAEIGLIQPRIFYMENTMSFGEIAQLYQLVDAYVSPYMAEGFNMPVLEAIACGLPVICTGGGSTDDFTTDEFALRVNSLRVPAQMSPEAYGFALVVKLEHLVHQMMTAVESGGLAKRARAAGPAFVAAGFTWQHATRRLLNLLF